MSTTIKRIALVAVAALGLGVVSVAPSSAKTFTDTLSLSSATATQLTGETATATSAVATLTFLSTAAEDSITVETTLLSAPAGNLALPHLLLTETASAIVSDDQGALTNAEMVGVEAGTPVSVKQTGSSTVNVTAKFKVYMNAPAKVGTYVVKLTPSITGGGGTLGGSAQTLTITVSQNPASDTVATAATSYITAGETYTATYAAADQVVTSTKKVAVGGNTDAAAVIRVKLTNAAGSPVSAESYTATISGPGVLGQGTMDADGLDSGVVAQGRSLLVRNNNVVGVFPDGTSGVSTITISSAAGVVLATEKVTFFGDAATISAKVLLPVIGQPAKTDEVLEVTVLDAAGTVVSGLDDLIGVVSSDTTKIKTTYKTTSTFDAATGTYAVSVTGVAAGTANLTVTTKGSATATTGVDAAAAVSVRVGSYKPASVKVTTDKSSYAPGEKGSLKVELFDADGLEVVSGETYTAIFTADGIVSSYALSSDSKIPAGTANVVSYADGGRLYTFYAPITEGDVKFSWKTGTTASGTTTGLALANQDTKGSVTIAVSSAATASAIAAANDAEQAASDATDAALAAADAADEATTKAQEAVDAVATLSAAVSKMISALKAQITSLSNLVAKIAKKVKA